MIKEIRDTILRDVIIKHDIFIGAYTEFIENEKKPHIWDVLPTNISDEYDRYIKINFEI